MLQEAGLGRLLSPTPPPPPLPFWKKLPVAVYAALGVLALLVTLLGSYPWLSIEEGLLLDPFNPYSEMFVVTNTGYIPITNLDAVCNLNMVSGGIKIIQSPGSGLIFLNFDNYLGHEGKTTSPCFHAVGTAFPVEEGATLTMIISYNLWPLTIKPLRRTQTFRFKSVGAKDGSQHWIFQQ
jgi:hypothetical protein